MYEYIAYNVYLFGTIWGFAKLFEYAYAQYMDYVIENY